MQNKDLDSLLKQAEMYNKEGVKWHHHFLTPKCSFNQSDNFRLLIENEDTGETFYTESLEKPTEQLKHLDNLFHSQRQ